MPSSSNTTIDTPPVTRQSLDAVVAQALGWNTTNPGAGNGNRAAEAMLTEVLSDLNTLGIPTPIGVIRVLEVRDNLHVPPALQEFIASRSVDALDPAAIAKASREHTAALGATSGPLGKEITGQLLERAVDELAKAVDDIVATIRAQHWTALAKAVAGAAASGLRAGTTAEQAIENDELVKAWRRAAAAVPQLDRLARTYYRLLLLTGFPVAVDEVIPQGRDVWLALSSNGPAELLTPAERPRIPGNRLASYQQGRRSQIARGWSGATSFLYRALRQG